MLWRALGHVEHGFYIHVGAQSPDVDSVTRAFSQAGWHGINVEPHPEYFEQLVKCRPRDVNLCCALGEHPGVVVMNFVGDTGLSTIDGGLAARHAAQGHVVSRAEVQMRTLEEVWDDHVPANQQVHFLKVDVEGFEPQVLRGNDWIRHRPWVVLVKATGPNSQVESYAQWESLLFESGYFFAYADGRNRYYVAREMPQLQDAIRFPPNVFDDFVSAELVLERAKAEQIGSTVESSKEQVARLICETDHLQQDIAALGTVASGLSVARAALASAHGKLAEAVERVVVAEASASAARMRERDVAHDLQRTVADRERSLQDARREAEDLRLRIQALLASSSWRLTAPLRGAARLAPPSVGRFARRVAKLAWWILTPWKMSRLRWLCQRNLEIGSEVATGCPLAGFDLKDDRSLSRATGLKSSEILWSSVTASDVADRQTAVRYVLDLLRTRSDVRARFPRALSDPDGSGFVRWLESDQPDLRFSNDAKHWLSRVLREDIAARARQMLLFRTDVREILPHGLTPQGQPALFRWFMLHGRSELKLQSEEVLWLFMRAAEEPMLELARAYLFTPKWQERFPDALTVFGSHEFSNWFIQTFGGDSSWVDLSCWRSLIPVDRQLRQAYFARPQWAEQFPRALTDESEANRFIAALKTGALSIPNEAHEWCAALEPEKVAGELAALGINMLAHFCTPSGLRISAESLCEGALINGLKVASRALRTDIGDDPTYVQFCDGEDFDVTIIHTQPTPFFEQAYALCNLHERSPRSHRVAYWYWEFDTVPESWLQQAETVDEVWTATEFVANGLRKRLSIPVRTMFPGVHLASFERRDRQYFRIDPNEFVFLFNFHMNSVMERKNPLGLIRAFKQAFRSDERATLVLKTMYGHHHPHLFEELTKAASAANIRIIDEIYAPSDVLALTEVCDVYVSLHRSEGLGLTMAEAMLLGKPVIATNYSGNLDFMNDWNSLLVPCKLVKLGRPMPPYDANSEWAEPSIEHAALLMRRLFKEPELARAIGQRAKQSAEEKLSVAAAGRRMAERIAEIRAGRVASSIRID